MIRLKSPAEVMKGDLDMTGNMGTTGGHLKDTHSTPVNHHHSQFTVSDSSLMSVTGEEAKPILPESTIHYKTKIKTCSNVM